MLRRRWEGVTRVQMCGIATSVWVTVHHWLLTHLPLLWKLRVSSARPRPGVLSLNELLVSLPPERVPTGLAGLMKSLLAQMVELYWALPIVVLIVQ